MHEVVLYCIVLYLVCIFCLVINLFIYSGCQTTHFGIICGRISLGGANPAVNTPRPSRGTRIESCDFIVLIGDP